MLFHTPTSRHVAFALHLGCRRTLSTSAARSRRHLVFEGRTTNDGTSEAETKTPFYLDTGYSIFAKRPSRPFPPPFLSMPSHSFSDPLTTHKSVRDRRPSVGDHLIRGITNGDDAIIVGGQNFLGVNDGVGAWAQKERGHAALWSRLIAHYWAVEVEKAYQSSDDVTLDQLNMVKFLQSAFEQSKDLTTANNEIVGTTTASSALLHHRSPDEPVVLATTLGDCSVLIIRPQTRDLIYKTTEQWHWFDCPRQLGTNSPDTPDGNAVMDVVDVKPDDIVCVVSDGVSDNLFENEIIEKLCTCFNNWQEGKEEAKDGCCLSGPRAHEGSPGDCAGPERRKSIHGTST